MNPVNITQDYFGMRENLIVSIYGDLGSIGRVVHDSIYLHGYAYVVSLRMNE